MNKIVFYDRVENDHISRWLSGLVKYFKNKGYSIEYSHGIRYNSLENCKLLIMWNGAQDIHKPLIALAKNKNVPILFAECGFFPQSKFYYLDNKGINAQSSLMDDNLNWINNQHINNLNKLKNKYLAGRHWCGEENGQYILCPLQLESDTNIIKYAPYNKMQDFIHHCEMRFPNDKIVFKNHPVLPNLNYKTKNNNQLIKSGNFLDLAVDAKLVYGQTSTALLESALLGVPTEAIGHCWLRYHKSKKDQLLAALVDKQIPVGEDNLDYWISNYE